MVGDEDGVPGDGPEDEEPGAGYRGWIDPDDRLWRHPSEMGPRPDGSPSGSGPAPWSRPSAGPAPGRSSRTRHVTTVAVSLVVALTAAGLAVAAATDRAATPASERSLLLSSTPTTSASVRDVSMTGVGRAALDLRPSLVVLVVRSRGRLRVGTGVVAQSGGIVVTSAGLVGASHRITAVEADGTWGSATVVGTSPAGLTVLRVGDDLPPAPFATDVPASGLPELAVAVRRGAGSGPRAEVYAGTVTDRDGDGDGAPVAAAGAASAGPTTDAATTVDSEAVSLASTLATTELDAPLGSSDLGCALMDRDGRVAGLMTSVTGSAGARATTFVPSVLVVHVVADLVASGSVTTGQLGVTGATDTGLGAGVESVAPGGPAAGAGIHPGDVITSVDGTAVRSVDQVRTALYGDPPGTEVTVGLHDGTGTTSVDTVLAAPAVSGPELGGPTQPIAF